VLCVMFDRGGQRSVFASILHPAVGVVRPEVVNLTGGVLGYGTFVFGAFRAETKHFRPKISLPTTQTMMFALASGRPMEIDLTHLFS